MSTEPKSPSSIGELLALTPEQLAELKGMPEAGKLIINSLMSTKQRIPNIEKRMRQPYYKEAYAKEIIPLLLKLKLDKKIISFPVQDFAPRYTQESLYQRIRQSIQYAEDHLDGDGTLKDMRESYSISRPDKLTVTLQPADEVDRPLVWQEGYSPIHSFKDVFDTVVTFSRVEDDGIKETLPNKNILQKGFSLSANEQTEIKKYLSKFGDIKALISTDKIELIKDSSVMKAP